MIERHEELGGAVSAAEEEVLQAARTNYFALLGELAVRWTMLELLCQHLAFNLASNGLESDVRDAIKPRFDVLLAGQSSAQNLEVMRVFADELGHDLLGQHIVHLKECLNWIRQHRNYYLHGISWVGQNPGEIVGIVSAITVGVEGKGKMARKRLAFLNDHIYRSKLDQVLEFCEITRRYMGFLLYGSMKPDLDEEGHYQELERIKPNVPEPLAKSSFFVLGDKKPKLSE